MTGITIISEKPTSTELPLRTQTQEDEAAARAHWNEVFLPVFGPYLRKIDATTRGHRITVNAPFSINQHYDVKGMLKDEMVVPKHPGIGVRSPKFQPTIAIQALADGHLDAEAVCLDFKVLLWRHYRNQGRT